MATVTRVKEPAPARHVKATGSPVTAAELEGVAKLHRSMNAEQPTLADEFRQATETKAKGKRQKEKPEHAFGVCMPRMLEPIRLDIPELTGIKAWAEAGQLDDGRWVGGASTSEEGMGAQNLQHPCHGHLDFEKYETRELAFAYAAEVLQSHAEEQCWPPDAKVVVEAFRQRWHGANAAKEAESYRRRGQKNEHTPVPDASREANRRQRELEKRYGDLAAQVAISRCTECGKEFEHDAGDAPSRCANCEPLGMPAAPREKVPVASSLNPEPRTLNPLSTVTPAGIAEPDALPPAPKAQRPTPTSPASQRPTRPSPGEPQGVGRMFLVELDRLGRNRFNPRERFDEAELAEFAERLNRDGQLQPILVRRATGTGLAPLKAKGLRKYESIEYEVVAGERRALAAVRAGWECVKAQEVDCDDARACELAIAENRDRKDISQVEYARGLQRLAGLKGLDPEGLAKDQGLSAQHVRNLLRLLKTPPEWQQLVIDGKIDGTHLRSAAPFLHVQAIAKRLAKEVAKAKDKFSVDEWHSEVRCAAWSLSARLEKHVYTPEYGRSTDVTIDQTHPQWAALDVVELDGEQYALNKPLAKKLLDEAEREWKKKQAKKSDKQDQSAAERQAAMTPAERKKHAADQRRKFDQRLENWFHDWLRVLCAAAVQPSGLCDNCEQGALWLTAYALWERPGNHYREAEVVAEMAGKKGTPILKLLTDLNGHAAAELMHAYAARMLASADGSPRGPTSGENPVIYDRVVAVLAGQVLGLDLAAAWKADRTSPMREKFWGLHSKDQLAQLGEELGVFVSPTLKKSQAVSLLLNQQKALPLPKDLVKLVARVQPTKANRKGAKSAKRKPR